MAEKRAGTPYIWVTTLAKLLTGENSCEWVGWFKAHYQNWKKPPSDFDSTGWMLQHTALVNRERDSLEVGGYEVHTENQNLFRLRGSTATIAGKPDLTVSATFRDTAGSREEFTKMMSEATRDDSPLDFIVVWKLHLFSISLEETIELRDRLRRVGTKLVSTTERGIED